MKLVTNNLIVILLSFFNVNLYAEAGGMEGGGGKVIACKNLEGNLSSVELLDLWESKNLYNKKISNSFAQQGVEAGLEMAFEVLKNSYPYPTETNSIAPPVNPNQPPSYDTGSLSPVCVEQGCVLDKLHFYSQPFLQANSTVRRLRGIRLELTDDSYEVAIPNGCEIQQVVNYQRNGTVYINQDLYDKLDVTNQIALIAHEAYYSFLRNEAFEKNSVRTRRIIGHVFSGNLIPFRYTLEPAEYLFCSNPGVPYAPTQITIYKDSGVGESRPNFFFRPELIQGTKLIGISRPDFGLPYANQKDFDFLKEGKCNSELGAEDQWFQFRLDGPVEFDRVITLSWNCKDGKYSPSLIDYKPGTKEVATIPLRCSFRKR